MWYMPYIYMEYTWYIPTIYLVGVPGGGLCSQFSGIDEVGPLLADSVVVPAWNFHHASLAKFD